jgi:hypothetical protein
MLRCRVLFLLEANALQACHPLMRFNGAAIVV